MLCGTAINKSYKDAYDSVARYEELRVINDFCVAFDAESYKETQRDVVQFRKDMAMLK